MLESALRVFRWRPDSDWSFYKSMREHGRDGQRQNPFRVGGVVTPPFFTNRDEEAERVARSLSTPQDHLLVFGPRRMGKTSLLRVVQERLRAEGRIVILADLSTASSVGEMTTRLLQAATREVGRVWSDAATYLVQRLSARITLEPDAASGMLLPSVGIGLDNDMGAQRTTFGSTLDAIDSLARARGRHLGLILDEFQEIHSFGGETAESHLRGIIQHHQHVSYVLAGSDERLIQAMIGKGRAFYKLLGNLRVGAMEPGHMKAWIEERMGGVGLRPDGIGTLIVEVAGPRTRDIVQLAKEVVDISPSHATVDDGMVATAFLRVVQGADAPYRAIWTGLSRLQQQVLRAVAVHTTGLTSASVRREFRLASAPGSIGKALQTLVARDVLVAEDGKYSYDDPFMRGWVITRALPDIGMSRSVMSMPGGTR